MMHETFLVREIIVILKNEAVELENPDSTAYRGIPDFCFINSFVDL